MNSLWSFTQIPSVGKGRLPTAPSFTRYSKKTSQRVHVMWKPNTWSEFSIQKGPMQSISIGFKCCDAKVEIVKTMTKRFEEVTKQSTQILLFIEIIDFITFSKQFLRINWKCKTKPVSLFSLQNDFHGVLPKYAKFLHRRNKECCCEVPLSDRINGRPARVLIGIGNPC